ncbi:hypothetical protein H4R19_002040 [Coemansia spiralis]|nr:hypothetical protein H4R19_002040 [Coemansia spiralis]
MSRATEVDRLPPPIETQSGSYVYYMRTSASGAQLYCRRPAAGAGAEQILMDPRTLEATYGYTLQGLLVSDSHRFIGCRATRCDDTHAGTESGSLLVFSLNDSGNTELVETLEGVFNFSFGDGDSVFYTVLNDKLRAHKVCWHRVHQPQSSDVDVYVEPDSECFVDITRTKDRKFHLINSSTLDSSEVRILPARSTLPPGARPWADLRLLRPRQRGVEYFVDHHSDEFVILTNSPPDGHLSKPVTAPLPFRLVRAPSLRPTSADWAELLCMPPGAGQIEDVEIFRDYIMVSTKRQGQPEVVIHNRMTRTNASLELPHGSCGVVRPEPNPQYNTAAVRIGFSSPVHLPSVVEYNMRTMQPSRSWLSTPLHIDPSRYAVRRENAPSGGVQIPLTLVHRRDVELSAAPPMLIRVYGSYGVSLEPEFRLEDVPLLLRGWVVALAHVRGGGDLGREWYASGKGRNKICAIRDLLGCTQHILERGWATPERLAVTGVSAGGLVVGAALNMSPEYYRAAALHVPFTDPLTAMLDPNLPLTGVETAEWGDPAASDTDYAAIRAYAPYDNIREPAALESGPSILVTAGGQDQRVSVWQPAKWVARLRSRGGYSAAVPPGEPGRAKLLFVPRMDQGHFHSDSDSGSGDDNSISAHALRNAFLISELTGGE